MFMKQNQPEKITSLNDFLSSYPNASNIELKQYFNYLNSKKIQPWLYERMLNNSDNDMPILRKVLNSTTAETLSAFLSEIRLVLGVKLKDDLHRDSIRAVFADGYDPVIVILHSEGSLETNQLKLALFIDEIKRAYPYEELLNIQLDRKFIYYHPNQKKELRDAISECLSPVDNKDVLSQAFKKMRLAPKSSGVCAFHEAMVAESSQALEILLHGLKKMCHTTGIVILQGKVSHKPWLTQENISAQQVDILKNLFNLITRYKLYNSLKKFLNNLLILAKNNCLSAEQYCAVIETYYSTPKYRPDIDQRRKIISANIQEAKKNGFISEKQAQACYDVIQRVAREYNSNKATPKSNKENTRKKGTHHQVTSSGLFSTNDEVVQSKKNGAVTPIGYRQNPHFPQSLAPLFFGYSENNNPNAHPDAAGDMRAMPTTDNQSLFFQQRFEYPQKQEQKDTSEKQYSLW